jgi:hypothetical protein
VSVPVAQIDGGRLPREARSGRRLAIASLLMVPALLVSYVAAYFVGVAFQDSLGLTEDELLTEAGIRGVAAAALLLVLLDLPQIVGIVLGVKARRLGERRLGTVGVVVNAVIAAFLLLTSVAQLVLA